MAGGNWQRGGGKGQRPKPTRRPNDTPTRIKPQARTVEEYDEILGWTPPAH